MIKRPMLMIPGPIDVPDEVLEPMGLPLVAHYGADWVPIYQETISLLQYAFCTQGWVVMLPGSGTTGLDAAVGSLLAQEDKVLVLSNGSFGDRLVAVAKAYRLEVHTVASSSLQPTPLEQVEDRLGEGGWSAVMMVHHETSSGVLNPVREVGDLCRRFDVPFIVDAVSSLGIEELRTDEWGIDLCVSASQKGLEAPPGLALVTVSDRAWEIMKQKAPTGHGFCLSLLTLREHLESWGDWHPSVVTMPTSIILALRVSLLRLQKEGIENRRARYARVSRAIRTGLQAIGFELLVEEPWASKGITAVKPPKGIRCDDIQRLLREDCNIAIARGAGVWQDQALRVGHMGLGTQPDHLVSLLMAMEQTLRKLGRSVARGSSLAGLCELWED